ncbi:MAG: GspH/FimT family pseudopilin [Burkholderiaceae bacterium]|nr:GspH/FimT family pseudopilin [Burkholderiaceae bacterium]
MRRWAGFSLIELMVVIAITAILLTLAAPSFVEMLARRRLEGVANELSADLQYARSLAVASHANTQVQVSSSTQYDITSPPGGTNYKTMVLTGGTTLDPVPVTLVFESRLGSLSTSADQVVTVGNSGTLATLKITVGPSGRVQICAPSGLFAGYKVCA